MVLWLRDAWRLGLSARIQSSKVQFSELEYNNCNSERPRYIIGL